jgi:5-methylcytosine-specific restriction endonuclease McrA
MSPGASPAQAQSHAHALDASVLVLNRFYSPVHVISARRAFCLLFKGLAEVVTLDEGRYLSFDFQGWREASETRALARGPDDDFVRAVHFSVQVPRVVRLLAYDRFPRHRVKFNRRNIFARDGHRCQYCGLRFATSELSLDHVLPRSRGGGADWLNIVSACRKCNLRKGGRTPREAGMRLLREPEQPRTSPSLRLKLSQRRYRSWRSFLDSSYSSAELT